MKKNLTKIFVILGLLIISTPLLLFVLQIRVKPTNKTEKKISLNFKRNFPLKKDLIEANALIKSKVFKSNPISDKVIDLNNGWKFLGNSFSNALSESKGVIVFNNEELNKLKKSLENKKAFLDRKNIKLYISVAANKHTVYGDIIPIRKAKRKTKLEQLDSICKTLDIKFINLSDGLENEKERLTYHKTDTHWNELGAFYGFKNTLNAISKDFSNKIFNIFSLDHDIEIKHNVNLEAGDLNQMLLQEKNELSIQLNIKNASAVLTEAKTLNAPENYQNNNDLYETRYSSEINNLKILLFCDSFSKDYKKFMVQNFGNSVFIRDHTFNKSIIKNEKPDIVLYEIVERDIDLLLN